MIADCLVSLIFVRPFVQIFWLGVNYNTSISDSGISDKQLLQDVAIKADLQPFVPQFGAAAAVNAGGGGQSHVINQSLHNSASTYDISPVLSEGIVKHRPQAK